MLWRYILRHTSSAKTLRTSVRAAFTSLSDTKYPHQIIQFIYGQILSARKIYDKAGLTVVEERDILRKNVKKEVSCFIRIGIFTYNS